MRHTSPPQKHPPAGRPAFAQIALRLVVLAPFLITTGIPPASAQPLPGACRDYAARCPSGTVLPACIPLRAQCEGAGRAVPPGQSQAGNTPPAPPAPAPLAMPACAENEELVMVPTCQCDIALGDDAAGDADTSCASCSPDGFKMACQKRP